MPEAPRPVGEGDVRTVAQALGREDVEGIGPTAVEPGLHRVAAQGQGRPDGVGADQRTEGEAEPGMQRPGYFALRILW